MPRAQAGRKSGRPIADWQRLVRGSPLAGHMELVNWLKAEHGMGHGHANAVVASTLAPMRGNVVDLAVAVIIGAAFGAVVSAFANDFIGGIIGAIGGSPDFGNAGPTVNDSKIVYGSTLTALIQFAIVAAAIYFVIVLPMQAMAERRGAAEDTPAPTDEAVLLTEIRDLLAAQGGGRPGTTAP